MTARLFPRRQWMAALALLQLLPVALAQRPSNTKTGTANAAPATDAHWVATWASAQQQPAAGRGGGGRGAGGQAAAAPAPTPAATPGPAAPAAGTLNNQTARMIVRTSIGGSRVRVQFSNA